MGDGVGMLMLGLKFAECCTFTCGWCEASEEVNQPGNEWLHELLGVSCFVGNGLIGLLVQIFSNVVDVQIVSTHLW